MFTTSILILPFLLSGKDGKQLPLYSALLERQFPFIFLHLIDSSSTHDRPFTEASRSTRVLIEVCFAQLYADNKAQCYGENLPHKSRKHSPRYAKVQVESGVCCRVVGSF